MRLAHFGANVNTFDCKDFFTKLRSWGLDNLSQGAIVHLSRAGSHQSIGTDALPTATFTIT